MSELPFDPQDLGAMLQRIGAMLSAPDDGPVAWSVVDDTVNEQFAAIADPAVTADVRSGYDDAARLAGTWLDAATVFPDDGATLQVWTRRQWVDRTKTHWRPLVEPLATRASSAFSEAMPKQMEALAPEMAAMMAGPMGQMAQRMGAAMFGMQLGQGIAELSRTVLTTGDLAVPLGTELAVVVANADAFGEGLGVSAADVRLHLALRAAAHHRLVMHAPWLAGRFASAIDDYARGINVDVESIERSLQGLDPSDPGAMQNALESGLFAPPDTPEQQAAQRRLGALIALVEGWVDDVVDQAATLMPSAASLREAGQRRRAAGGPAEQTFAALIGLELRPRRQRDAAALWAQLREQRGIEGRDALWDHPDLLPTDSDLDDTTVFLAVGDIDWSALEAELASDAEQAEQDEESEERASDDGMSEEQEPNDEAQGDQSQDDDGAGGDASR
jgi:putative hydrolase